jgi:hypothetical protein
MHAAIAPAKSDLRVSRILPSHAERLRRFGGQLIAIIKIPLAKTGVVRLSLTLRAES